MGNIAGSVKFYGIGEVGEDEKSFSKPHHTTLVSFVIPLVRLVRLVRFI
jgi:hypothetical protein